MEITKACAKILYQLTAVITEIEEHDYTRSSEILSGSTIGQHIRHTLEFFVCLEAGFEKGIVNYDKRAHDKQIEVDKLMALKALERISTFVQHLDFSKPLQLEVGYDPMKEEFATVETNALRELVYNIEHAVHHMALIKIGIRENAAYVNLPVDFGIAASTKRYREAERLYQHR
jgi:hypothetical protein